MNVLEQNIKSFRKTPDGKIMQGCDHTVSVLNHKYRNSIIMNAVKNLTKISNSFDSIACSGTSGLLVVPQIAEILDKNIIVIRKSSDKCYSKFEYEGVVPDSYIIIDDLICSGKTIRYIQNIIKEDYERSSCYGVYCYMPQYCAYSKALKVFQERFKTKYLNLN